MKNIMKNIKSYYIKFENIKDESLGKEVCDFLSSVLDPEDEKYVVIESEKYNSDESDYEFMYLFIEDFKVNKILNFLINKGLVLENKDVTDDILTSKIFDEVDFDKVYNGFPESKTTKELLGDKYTEEFKYIFDNFILRNLTVDGVLDKINERGIESLTDVDRQILDS